MARRMHRFRLRTLKKVNIEALMVAAGQNVKRLLVWRRRGPRSVAQAMALRLPDPLLFCFRHRVRRRQRRVSRRVKRSFSTSWIIFGTEVTKRREKFCEVRSAHLLKQPMRVKNGVEHATITYLKGFSRERG